MNRKLPGRVRHIPVSPPWIGRRGCGVRLPHSFGDMGELNQPAVVLSLAGGGARDGEDISEHRSVRIIREGRARCSNRFEGADQQNRRSVGKSTRSLLAVRATVGSDFEAKLPAMDKSRTTEAARLDRIAFPARSQNAAPALADIGARHVASARRRLTDGPGLVHDTRPGGGAACSRGGGAEVD